MCYFVACGRTLTDSGRLLLGLLMVGTGLFFCADSVPYLARWLNTVTQKYLLTSPNYCNTVITRGRAYIVQEFRNAEAEKS